MKNINITDLRITNVTKTVEDGLRLDNVTMSDEQLVGVFGSIKCKTLCIRNMVLSDNVSTSLGQCVNNNVTQLKLGGNGPVTFNFRLFSACVTYQSKCNSIERWFDTADKYQEDFKHFCKQSRTWSVTWDEMGWIKIERK